MDKAAIYLQIFSAIIAGAATGSRGKVNNNVIELAAGAAHVAVERLEGEMAQYEEKVPPKQVEAAVAKETARVAAATAEATPKRRGRPPLNK